MYIAERLKNERTKLEISQKDLGRLTNLASNTISKLELGTYNAPRETVEKVCNKLGFREDEFEEEYTAGNRQFDQRIFFAVVYQYYKKISELYLLPVNRVNLIEKVVPKTTKNFDNIKCYLENGNLYNGLADRFDYNKKFEKLMYNVIIKCDFKPSIIFIINLFIELRAMDKTKYVRELHCFTKSTIVNYLSYSVCGGGSSVYKEFLEESRKYILDFISKRDVCLKRPIWKFIYDYLIKYDKKVDCNNIDTNFIKTINDVSINDDYKGILDFEFFDKLIEKCTKSLTIKKDVVSSKDVVPKDIIKEKKDTNNHDIFDLINYIKLTPQNQEDDEIKAMNKIYKVLFDFIYKQIEDGDNKKQILEQIKFMEKNGFDCRYLKIKLND